MHYLEAINVSDLHAHLQLKNLLFQTAAMPKCHTLHSFRSLQMILLDFGNRFTFCVMKQFFSLSHYRPGQALLGLQEVQAPRISRQVSHEDGKIVSPTYRFVPLLCTIRHYKCIKFDSSFRHSKGYIAFTGHKC